MIFPGVGFLKNAKINQIINDFFLIINLNSMHPFMDHILKLNTGQGSIYSNSQIIHLLIYFSTFSLKIFFSNIVQLYAMFHYTKESDSMILLIKFRIPHKFLD